MDFYNDPRKVNEYEKMCEEYDGTELYKILAKHLKKNSTLLELGCGPGNDIKTLQNMFSVTGSDLSDEFLKRCKNRLPEIPFLKISAISINTDERFDSVFSNKVLHHLTLDELNESLRRQQSVIKTNGIFAHTFWIGDKVFEMEGMLFIYHKQKELLDLVSKYFSILQSYSYKEFEDNDSLFIIARNDKSK